MRKIPWPKFIPFLVLTSLIFTLAVPVFVYAQAAPPSGDGDFLGIGAALKSALMAAVRGIALHVTYWIGAAGGYLFSFAGFLTDIALKLNFGVINDVIVRNGWAITRDIANLGFVLMMVVIAIATMIQYHEYEAKKLLVRLVGAAILVNFSLAIAGLFIDFSHVIGGFFWNRISQNPDTVALVVAGAFNVQQLLLQNEEIPEPPGTVEFESLGEAFLIALMAMIFTLVFTFLAALVMLMLAFMLIVRYLWLVFLLILAPLTWLFWIIPPLSGQHSQWWSKFMKWVFFFPGVSFFVFLAIKSADALGSQAVAKTEVGNFFGSSLIGTIFTQGARMIVLCGLMIGGLMVAQDMGITGASKGMGFAKAAGAKAKALTIDKARDRAVNMGKGALDAGQRALTYPLRTNVGRKIVNRLQTAGTYVPWYMGGALVRGALAPVRGAARMAGKASTAVDAKVGEAHGKVDKMKIEEQAQNYQALNNYERAAVQDNMIKARKEKVDKRKGAETQQRRSQNRLHTAEQRRQAADALYTGLRNDPRASQKEIREAEQQLRIAELEVQNANDTLTDAQEAYRKAQDEITKFEQEVIAILPRYARRDLESANYQLKNTRQAGSYQTTYARAPRIGRMLGFNRVSGAHDAAVDATRNAVRGVGRTARNAARGGAQATRQAWQQQRQQGGNVVQAAGAAATAAAQATGAGVAATAQAARNVPGAAAQATRTAWTGGGTPPQPPAGTP